MAMKAVLTMISNTKTTATATGARHDFGLPAITTEAEMLI
jgi:hypothetical protein